MNNSIDPSENVLYMLRHIQLIFHGFCLFVGGGGGGGFFFFVFCFLFLFFVYLFACLLLLFFEGVFPDTSLLFLIFMSYW